jgi:hypothetical protein
MKRRFLIPSPATRSVQDADDQLQQQFHLENQDFFRDYEELEDRVQQLLYDKPSTIRFLEHCRRKARRVIESQSEETLVGPSGFPRRDVSRAELHVINIRHIHHHSAQLSLRLRLDHEESIPWFGTGWTIDCR